MLQLSAIYIYPVKGIGGISVQEAALTSRGLAHDRRWMIVDEKNQFLSQRKFPKMALLQARIAGDQIRVEDRGGKQPPLQLPLTTREGRDAEVTIWKNKVHALLAPGPANRWISQVLGTQARFVYMPDNAHRIVDPHYVPELEIVSFADGFQHLLIGQASLNDLNTRLETPVSMNRFRPNLVVSGAEPYAEFTWAELKIGGLTFFGRKPCARCSVTTVNQETGEKGREPLQTMNGYLKHEHKILFGENLIHDDEGSIRVGDSVEIVTTKPSPLEN